MALDAQANSYTQGFEHGWKAALKFVAEDRLDEAEPWFQSVRGLLQGQEPNTTVTDDA